METKTSTVNVSRDLFERMLIALRHNHQGLLDVIGFHLMPDSFHSTIQAELYRLETLISQAEETLEAL